MRLMERVAAKIAAQPGGCWLWQGAIRNGYGVVQVGTHAKPRAGYVHRLMFAAATGEAIPSGFDVCHTCDVRSCVNPAHLFLGTRLDNMRDSKAKGWPNGKPRVGRVAA